MTNIGFKCLQICYGMQMWGYTKWENCQLVAPWGRNFTATHESKVFSTFPHTTQRGNDDVIVGAPERHRAVTLLHSRHMFRLCPDGTRFITDLFYVGEGRLGSGGALHPFTWDDPHQNTIIIRFKDSCYYWLLLKIIIGIKPYLITSNGGEVGGIKHCE